MTTSDDRLEQTLRTAATEAGTAPEPSPAMAGHADVVYAVATSPFGDLCLAATELGLARVTYLRDRDLDTELDELARVIGPRVVRSVEHLGPVARQLDEYFAGAREHFELDLDLRSLPAFTRRVLDAASAIPYGRVRTYSEVAALAGSPQGARAAGNALGSNPVPIVVPCHRVVRAGGHLGGYTGGLDVKEHLLRLEGVIAA